MSQTWEKYQTAGIGARAGVGTKPALLVVDFCLGMTSPKSPLGLNADSAIEATKQLLQIFREKALPAVFTTVRYTKGCKDGGAFVRKIPSLRVFEEGNGNWSELDPRLPNLPEEPIVIKRFASAFFGTNLASLLTAERVDTVMVTGCSTSGCVRASALDALQSGFSVIVPRDCVADRAADVHEANLFDLNAKYADVVSLDDALTYLRDLAT